MSGTVASARTLPVRTAFQLAVLFTLTFLLFACNDGGPVLVRQVVVVPGATSMHVGDQLTYSARALDERGQDIEGRNVEWSTTDEALASVSADGVVTGLSAGTVSVVAVIDGKIGSSSLRVAAAPVATLEIQPTPVNLVHDESRTLVAIARDGKGRVLTGRKTTWTSNNPTVVSVDAGGRVTAGQTGSAEVTASVEDHTVSVAASVGPAAVETVEISPSSFVIEIGEQKQLQVIARDVSGRELKGRDVLWTMDDGTISITQDGMVTGIRKGIVTVFASIEGVSGEAAGTIVNPPPYAGAVARAPAPSPDGSRVAFAISMDDLGTGTRVDDIDAVDRRGMNSGTTTRITLPGIEANPSWSPDGKLIAFTSGVSLYAMQPDGSNVRLRTVDPSWGGGVAPSWINKN